MYPPCTIALGWRVLRAVATFCPANTRVTAFAASVSTIFAHALVASIHRTGLHLSTTAVRATRNCAIFHVAHFPKVRLSIAGADSAEDALAVRTELEVLPDLDAPADQVPLVPASTAEEFDAKPAHRVLHLSLTIINAAWGNGETRPLLGREEARDDWQGALHFEDVELATWDPRGTCPLQVQ